MVIPEPFSLLATSLGMTATILNFLLSSIPSLEQKYYRFNNIDEKILKSLNALKDIEFSFQRWLDTYTWAQGPFHEQHYEDHFGKTEWQDIKYRRDQVMKYIGSLRQQLHLTVQPDTPDPQTATPTSPKNHSRQLWSSYKRVSENLNHGVKKVFHKKKKGSASKSKIQPTPPSLEHTSLQGLNTQEYETWTSFVCLDRSPQLETPPISLGYKVIAILSAKWERIERSVDDLNFAMTGLVSITSAYQKHQEARQNEDLLKFAAGKEKKKNDFSRFAKYVSSEIMKPQNERPSIGWHLQVSDFERREKASGSETETQPQKILDEIVRNCHFLFATHINIDANFSTRGLELKAVKGNMIPAGTTWKTPADLWSDDKFRCLSGANSEWFLRIEDLPGLKTFRFKTSRAQRIKIWTKDWQKLLAEAMINKHTRKIFDVERARLVFGLTVWMILLWEEDWFSHICTCSLRCVLFGEAEDGDAGWSGTGTSAPFLLPLQHVYSLDTLNQGPRICRVRSCAGTAVPTSPEKKLQLFAILLAEILLVRKIVTDENGRPSGRCSDDSEYGLVQSVKLDVDFSIAEGLQFCFERAGGDGMWSELRTIEQQKELTERVLKPAKKYYQTLSSRPENKKWAEKLHWEVMSQQDESFKVV